MGKRRTFDLLNIILHPNVDDGAAPLFGEPHGDMVAHLIGEDV